MTGINELAPLAKRILRNAVESTLTEHQIATGEMINRLTDCAVIEELRKIIAELDHDGGLTS